MAWIPGKLAEKIALAQSVQTGVTANGGPTAYGFTSGEWTAFGTEITTAVNDQTAYLASLVTSAGLLTARNAAVDTVEHTLGRLDRKAKAAGTSATLMAGGHFPLPDTVPTPSGTASTHPGVVLIDHEEIGVHSVHYKDSASALSAERPHGQKGADIECIRGGATPGPTAVWEHVVLSTHHIQRIVHPAGHGGETIYYRLRWISKNPDAAPGPWSPVFSATLAG